ncbi:MAG TPA: nucleotide sugar dehydrogenase, partial [Candidatus Methylomirabilis sp.]|nr:nucleotide sugar dehydrogenase [Candidatus Methylomirabilis sp.]
MKIGVAGLWHLGPVTAACLAAAGHEVVAYDGEATTIARIESGRLPVAEPGLGELIAQGAATGALRFSSRPADLGGADVAWITYDTPVDGDGRADVEAVFGAASAVLSHLRPASLVLVSSQLPVGSTRRLETIYRDLQPGGAATFAAVPENLRLGSAIDSFTRPARVVVGIRAGADKERIAALLAPFTGHIEWMGVESAEMTKHALNAFLATSVAFANELAGLCERVGADAEEVERGLKSDVRIGPRAYLRPGGAFAGGTLARDVQFLIDLGRSEGLSARLMAAVRDGNEAHKEWPRRRLLEVVGDARGKRIAILGLTYKPGTDTLRGSSALETSRWLRERGARVVAYDPAISALPDEISPFLELRPSVGEALQEADAA